MSWRRWKRGLIAAGLSGGLSSVVGLAIGIHWEQVLILLAVSVSKNMFIFMQKNPVDQLGPDTNPPFKRR